MDSTLKLLLERRSVVARDLHEPGPDAEQLDGILKAAHRVPDHGKIGPWRFIVIQGESRISVGKRLGEVFVEHNPEASDKAIEFEQQRFTRAPAVIAVIFAPETHPKVPEWEQALSAGAACQNILIAAHAMGFGAQWLTEWYAFDQHVDAYFQLKETEKFAGFIYLGSFDDKPAERNRPSLEDRITFWEA